MIISSSLPYLSSGKCDLCFLPQRVSQPPMLFIYKTLEPETHISLCLSPYSAESQRADTRLTLGFSGMLARWDNVWEAA